MTGRAFAGRLVRQPDFTFLSRPIHFRGWLSDHARWPPLTAVLFLGATPAQMGILAAGATLGVAALGAMAACLWLVFSPVRRLQEWPKTILVGETVGSST